MALAILIAGCSEPTSTLPDPKPAIQFFENNQPQFSSIADLLASRPNSKRVYCIANEAWHESVSDTLERLTNQEGDQLAKICRELGGVDAWKIGNGQFVLGGAVEHNGRQYQLGFTRDRQGSKPNCEHQMASSGAGECLYQVNERWSVVYTWVPGEI